MQNQHMIEHHGKHFSWFPVVMGALVGVGLAFLLNLFSIAIGLSAFTTDPTGTKILAVGGLIGMLIGVVATMFTSGFTAGYLSGQGCCRKNLGVVYGFGAWCLSLILMALVASAIGTYAVAYASFMDQPRVIDVVEQVQITAHETAKSVSNQANPTVKSNTTKAEKNVKAVGFGSFLLFVLFFVAAFSSSLGGWCGFECWKKHKEGCETR